MEDRYRIKVLEKAFRILELFDGKGKELSAAEIAAVAGLNKASTFRILRNLESWGYLEKESDGGRYRLGLKLFYLGSQVDARRELRRLARPFLEELKERFGETVHLAVLDAGEALYLEKIEGNRAIRVISRVGMKLPAHCSGVGKMLLSGLSDNELDVVIQRRGLPRRTENTITEPTTLKRELTTIRERGYSIDDEEIEKGLKCVAAPLRDGTGTMVAAISLSGPKERFDAEETLEITRIVVRTADRISEVLRKKEIR